MTPQKKYWLIGTLAILSLTGLIYLKQSKKKYLIRDKKGKNVKKNIYTFSGHPLNVIWAPGSDRLGLFVSGDRKNIDLGLKVGSLLVSIKSKFNKNVNYRVLGVKSNELRKTLQLLRDSDFPIDLTFVQQDDLNEQWTQSMLHRSNGSCSFKNNNFEDALKEYKLALDVHPTQKLLHSNKALCLIKLNRFDEALVVCKEMLNLDPSFPKAHYLKAKVCENIGLKAESLQKKILYFEHAITELRIMLSKQSNNEEAREKLKSCLTLLKNTRFVFNRESKVKQSTCKNKQKEQIKIFRNVMIRQRKKVESEFEAKTIRFKIYEKFISDHKLKEKIWKRIKNMTIKQLKVLLEFQETTLNEEYSPAQSTGFYGMSKFIHFKKREENTI